MGRSWQVAVLLFAMATAACSNEAAGGSGGGAESADSAADDAGVDTRGGDGSSVLKQWTALCAPCDKDEQCANGAVGAQCIDYGGQGSFCGAACGADGDCPTGYSCLETLGASGTAAKQCRLSAATALCECNAWAVSVGAQTSCETKVGSITCAGKRSCGPSGLSACAAVANAKESCDGLDNDCDGKVDNGACDDGNSCTEDVCNGASGQCAQTPKPGSCDDGNACTTGDSCAISGTAATCAAGTGTKDCDDDNVCTEDACEPAKGCTALPKAATAACYDGPATTAGVGTCTGGYRSCGDGALEADCKGQVTPAAKEACDYKDDDCDGTTDEGCKVVAAEVTTGCGFGHLAAPQTAALSVSVAVGDPVAGRRVGMTHIELGWLRWLMAWWP